MGYIVFFMVFATVFMFSYTLVTRVYREKSEIVNRLDNVNKLNGNYDNTELNKPLFIRFIRPIFDDLGKTILKIAPNEIVRAYEKKVILAGFPFNLSVKDWINMVVVFSVGLPILTVLSGLSFSIEIKTIIFLVISEIVAGLLLPNYVLNSYAKKRKKEIVISLPDVLDLLTVSVEAGLGFDSALSKVVEKIPGALSCEFEQVLNEIKVGKQKRDSLRDMAVRLSIRDVTTFISSIIQAEQLGVSIGKVLRIQSEQMRQRRKQIAQEKAMKAPIKMLIPMVLFIFPTIFMVLLGPVIVKMLTSK